MSLMPTMWNRHSLFVDREVETYNHRMGRSQPKVVRSQGELPDRVADARGFEFVNNSMRMSKVLGVEPGKPFSRNDIRRVFNKMDADRSGEVDYDELKQWVLASGLFKEASAKDSLLKLEQTFDEIDQSGDRQLDFEEFFKFIQLLERERKALVYASKHHCTALPKSQDECNEKLFTLEYIESQLHRKIEQYTSSDTDRFRKILGYFKSQVQRTRDGGVGKVLGITKRDFRKMLSWLGLFATEDQARKLFDRYDINGDNCLTVHEFLTQARPPDFPGSRRNRTNPKQFNEFLGGKKLFKGGGVGRGGTHERLKTPHIDCYPYFPRHLAETIRKKLGQSGKVGQVYPDARGFRDLMKYFQYHDKANEGIVSYNKFLAVMKMLGVNATGTEHHAVLFNKFSKNPLPNKLDSFDYVEFCKFTFPKWSTSPDKQCKALSLDLRNKHCVTLADGGVELRTGRRSERVKGERKIAPAMVSGRSLSRSESDFTGRAGKSTRRMSRSATEKVLSRPGSKSSNQNYEMAPLRPQHMTAQRIKQVNVHLDGAEAIGNPLQATLPDNFHTIRKSSKKAIVL